MRRSLFVAIGALAALACGSSTGLSDAGGQLDSGIDAGPEDAGTVNELPYGYDCSGQQDVIELVRRSGMLGTDGLVHAYYSYVPETYDAGAEIPLIVSLHGAGDTASNFVGLWEMLSEENGFMVLVPEASSALGSGFTWSLPGDISVIEGAITDIQRCYHTDLHRYILHGLSAGGYLGYILGLSQTDLLFSGLVIASSDLGLSEQYAREIGLPPLLPSGWLIPVSISHGVHDPNFPFEQDGVGSRNALVDAGHTVYFHPFDGGHMTDPAQALQAWNDLKSSVSP